MADTGVDFRSMLADLQGKRAALQQAIDGLDMAVAGLTQLVTLGMANGSGDVAGSTSPAVVLPGDVSGRIRSDTFFNLNVVEAAKKYLRMVNRTPQSPEAIAQALARGGLQRKSDSIDTLMRRHAKQTLEFVKITGSGEWALKEWYDRKDEEPA